MALCALAMLLEGRAAERARHSIRRLFQLVPDTCEVQLTTDEWQNIPVDQINTGQHFRVSPGRRIALDGDIVIEASAVDQSAVTGESLPIEKVPRQSISRNIKYLWNNHYSSFSSGIAKYTLTHYLCSRGSCAAHCLYITNSSRPHNSTIDL